MHRIPAVLVALLIPQTVLAAWPNQATVNLPVSRATGDQLIPTIVSDGSGGAIMTWYDLRNGNDDIYAQHVLASGTVDPAWPADGRALCTAANNQIIPMIVSDGSGGAIVTWYDFRSGPTSDIYAQHVLASGVVDPAWPADGRVLCAAVNNQTAPTIVSDGSGGAIVAWVDLRGGATTDIYAQHVLASGAVDPVWPPDGRILCGAASTQQNSTIAADGSGGAFVTWQDLRNGNLDIYAQHVLASGAVDPAWLPDGRFVCLAIQNQQNPTIISDGSGGAIITWFDFRNGANDDIYAQHVLPLGIDPGWPNDGRALCTAANPQQFPTIASDGANGAIVTWQDQRGSTGYDIYAQHVLASGAVDAAWPADGRALCTVTTDQRVPTIVPDGSGGAIVSWFDTRNGGTDADIYAQHVQASGAVDPAWPADGRALCTASNNQFIPTISSDGSGGAIVTWYDYRSAAADIYAQRVARFGYLGTPEAEITEVKDVPNDNGGKLKLAWSASYLDLGQDPNLAAYDLYRSAPPNVAAEARAGGQVRTLSAALPPLERGQLVAFPAAAQSYAWEYVATVSVNHFASQYSYLAPTAEDSTGYGNPKTAFLVLARNASGSMFWPSRPDSGYSVDNLPPLPPGPFAGTYGGGTAALHWRPNAEPDLANYRLYRGATSSFTPSVANRIATPADTTYSDPAGSPYWYKLSAVDAHGNESGFVSLLPAGVTGVEPGDGPGAVAFERPRPNPAEGPVTLSYALPREERVDLVIYDTGGRRMRTLESGVESSGEHTATWDLRDDAGHIAAPGLYFARLEAGGLCLSRRFATVK